MGLETSVNIFPDLTERGIGAKITSISYVHP
jgi:hypothetical protein